MTFQKGTEASPATDGNNPEDVNAAAPDNTDANPAASSTVDDQDAKKPASLLDVVKSAVEKEEPGADSSAAGADEGSSTDPEANAEGDDESDANVPFHNHPRWKAVVAERDELRHDADQFRKIEEFRETAGLSPEEVSQGYIVMAALKSDDPEKLKAAREYFAAGLAQLDTMLGNELPDDLRERVELGLLDEDTAQETARLRAAEALRGTRDQRTAEAQRQRTEAETRQATATEMMQAVETWEQGIKQSDPDYARKEAMIETTCRAIVQRTGKPPQNAEQAVALVKEAHREVTEQLKGVLPRKRPITPGPTGQSTPTVAAPKTLRDAINAAVNA